MESGQAPNLEEIYRVAVGEAKADYYVPRFLQFDEPGAARTGWNWPAFFLTFFWLLYRRMYGYAFAYLLLLPFVFAIFGLIVTLLLGERAGSMLYLVGVLGAGYVLIPIYANALYHSHVRQRIAKLQSGAPSPDALVQRMHGYTAVTNVGLLIGVSLFFGVALVGMLAAIAIPAYQDYTIRAQVVEGLNLASGVRASIGASYAQTPELPVDAQALGLDSAALRGKYVESIEVDRGVILIRYGDAAHPAIRGRTLSLQPLVTGKDDAIVWGCGYRNDTRLTDVAEKYLPSACRRGAAQVE